MDVDSRTLGWLIGVLEPRLYAALATRDTVGGSPEGVLQEARLAVTSGRREIEKPHSRPAGTSRLRSLRYWRDRERRVCETVDRTLLELLYDAPGFDSADDSSKDDEAGIERHRLKLRHELDLLIERLPPRCRDLLRLHYGLDVVTDQIALRVGDRSAGVRKATGRCLAALAQVLIELGLELRSPE